MQLSGGILFEIAELAKSSHPDSPEFIYGEVFHWRIYSHGKALPRRAVVAQQTIPGKIEHSVAVLGDSIDPGVSLIVARLEHLQDWPAFGCVSPSARGRSAGKVSQEQKREYPTTPLKNVSSWREEARRRATSQPTKAARLRSRSFGIGSHHASHGCGAIKRAQRYACPDSHETAAILAEIEGESHIQFCVVPAGQNRVFGGPCCIFGIDDTRCP